jgi:iron complex outermembrane receptor protein
MGYWCWRRAAMAWVVMAGLVCGLGAVGALGQEKTSTLPPAPLPPTLPETVVEGNPKPSAQPTNPFVPEQPSPQPSPAEPSPESSAGPPILQDNTFASPPADGYRADSSTTGTRINLPDINIPATVSVVPQQAIADQQARQLDDVLRDAPATIAVGGNQFFSDQIYIRGLEVSSHDFRRDNFLDPTLVPRDLDDIQRVEILQGPASVLYGSASPSGTVNFITKKPMDAQFANFGMMFGSFGDQRYTLDVNGRVTDDGNVLYRVNGDYEHSDSFRDFGYLNRNDIAPAVTWLIDDDTSLTWQGDAHKHDTRGDLGIPALGGNALALPISLYVGEPANDFFQSEEYRQTLVLNHKIDDNWQYTIGGSSLFYDVKGSETAALAQIGPTEFLRARYDTPLDHEQAHELIANLAGDFTTGQIEHKALLGFDYSYFDADSDFQVTEPYAPIDVAAPVYTNPPAVPPPTLDLRSTAFRQPDEGFYLQDYVKLDKYWQLLGGVRFDMVDFTYDRTVTSSMLPFPLPARTEEDFNAVSPRAGIVFQPLPDVLAFYFNYSRSFNPPEGGVYLNTTPLKAELGESFELGTKAVLLEGLTFGAAGFYVTRDNAPFMDPATLTLFQVGQQRSQGVEMSLTGKLTKQWSVLANWAYLDTKLTDPTNPEIFGQPNLNVPHSLGNVWTRYNLIDYDKRTLGAALGLVAVGPRSANLADTVTLPGYTRWDAGLYYRRDRWNFSLYFENIFNTKYAVSSIDENQIMPGAPFTVRGQAMLMF